MLRNFTPHSLSTTVETLANVQLTEASELDVVTDVLLNNALSQHERHGMYLEMYADMALALRTRFPEFPETRFPDEPNLTFTRAFLNRCQEEFENIENQKEFEFTEKQRVRMFEYMKFLGQLYLRGIVSHKVIREVGVRLVFKNEPSPGHFIECFCTLIRTVGAKLELSDQGKSYMQQFIIRMRDMRASPDYSEHTKLAVEDLLELRANYWQDAMFFLTPD